MSLTFLSKQLACDERSNWVEQGVYFFPDGNEHRRYKRFDLGKEKLPSTPTCFPNVSLERVFLLSGVGKPFDLHITDIRDGKMP